MTYYMFKEQLTMCPQVGGTHDHLEVEKTLSARPDEWESSPRKHLHTRRKKKLHHTTAITRGWLLQPGISSRIDHDAEISFKNLEAAHVTVQRPPLLPALVSHEDTTNEITQRPVSDEARLNFLGLHHTLLLLSHGTTVDVPLM